MSMLYYVLLYLQRVQFEFIRFNLESCSDTCDCDKFYIYDGSDATALLTHSICHEKFLLGDITSSGNTVFVYFGSNANSRYRGFEIRYSSVEGKTDCFKFDCSMVGETNIKKQNIETCTQY